MSPCSQRAFILVLEHVSKISMLSHFSGWVLDIRIVLNSYFSITLKKKDWSFLVVSTDIFYESVHGLKIVQNPLNTFQTTLFRTSACQRQPSCIQKESLATALLIDIRPTLSIWKLLTASGVRSLCTLLTEGSTHLGVPRLGWIFTFFFKA